MKKELFAAALLIIIIAGAIINTHHLYRLDTKISALVDEAQTSAINGDWKSASEHVQSALDLWRKNDGYTHLVLRHEEINSATEAIYQLLLYTYSEDIEEAVVSAEMVKEHFRSLSLMERPRLGSIF